MTERFVITGRPAISVAERLGTVPMYKYADPTDGARTVSLQEAREIASEDPGLVYVGGYAALMSCKTTGDLLFVVDAAEESAGIELRGDLTWPEIAQLIEDSNPGLAGFLRYAEKMWSDLE